MTAPPLIEQDAAVQPTASPSFATNDKQLIPGRFNWEKQLRSARIPRHLKGFLLYLGTWMDAAGRNCRPSSRTICSDMDLSRQRVFELFSEAELRGWLRTEKRPGKPSERLPATPDPSDPSDGSPATEEAPTRQTHLTHPSDPSDPTRQTGLTQPEQHQNRTRPSGGDARPQTPQLPEHASRTRTDQIDPLTAVPDLNGTKQVTSRPRARNQLVQSPLLAIVETGIREYGIDDYQLTLPVPVPAPPPLDPEREQLWPQLAQQLTRINQGTAS